MIFSDGTIEWTPAVTMNFTYRFADDPLDENLLGNITWKVDMNEPAHWTHSELTCKLIGPNLRKLPTEHYAVVGLQTNFSDIFFNDLPRTPRYY